MSEAGPHHAPGAETVASAAPPELVALRANAARITIERGFGLENLSCQSRGRRVGLVGAWGPLFKLLAAQARLDAGELLVAGVPARDAVASGRVGVALCDPVLPKAWSGGQYLEESSRLAGLSRRSARQVSRDVLQRLRVAPLADRNIGGLAHAERRILLVAHALITNPALLAIETPLADLTHQDQAFIDQRIELASADRALLVSLPAHASHSVERNLLDRMDQVLSLEAGGLVSEARAGEGAHGRSFLVVTTQRGTELRQLLVSRGYPVADSTQRHDDNAFVVRTPEQEGTAPILDASLETRAPVLELVPLATAPATRPAAG